MGFFFREGGGKRFGDEDFLLRVNLYSFTAEQLKK
jgi:hypothetical protein